MFSRFCAAPWSIWFSWTKKQNHSYQWFVSPIHVFSGNLVLVLESLFSEITAGFLSRAGAETPPKLSRKFRVFQNDFGKLLRGGYPNRSSGIHRWGLDLSTRYPKAYFSWFSGYPQLTSVFLPGDENFQIFSWGACHENQGLSTSSV